MKKENHAMIFVLQTISILMILYSKMISREENTIKNCDASFLSLEKIEKSLDKLFVKVLLSYHLEMCDCCYGHL
jgi:hypothetical protein